MRMVRANTADYFLFLKAYSEITGGIIGSASRRRGRVGDCG